MFMKLISVIGFDNKSSTISGNFFEAAIFKAVSLNYKNKFHSKIFFVFKILFKKKN